MSGENTTLSCVCWCQIEIEDAIFIRTVFLNKFFVDDAAAWWVNKSLALFYKEALGNTLVNNDYSDSGLLGNLVIKVAYNSLQLGNLVRQDLLTHGITNTVSIDYKVSWFTLVLLLK